LKLSRKWNNKRKLFLLQNSYARFRKKVLTGDKGDAILIKLSPTTTGKTSGNTGKNRPQAEEKGLDSKRAKAIY
jgi:V8-like Glu-specific endopeptidase